MEDSISLIENQLNYKFENKEILKFALSKEINSNVSELKKINQVKQLLNNEFLELIGDSVLNLVIITYLFESNISNIKNINDFLKKIVNNSSLKDFGMYCKLNILFDNLKENKTKKIINNKNLKSKNIADTVECIMGAIFLDTNYNFSITKFIILNWMNPYFKFFDENISKFKILDLNYNKIVTNEIKFSLFPKYYINNYENFIQNLKTQYILDNKCKNNNKNDDIYIKKKVNKNFNINEKIDIDYYETKKLISLNNEFENPLELLKLKDLDSSINILNELDDDSSNNQNTTSNIDNDLQTISKFIILINNSLKYDNSIINFIVFTKYFFKFSLSNNILNKDCLYNCLYFNIIASYLENNMQIRNNLANSVFDQIQEITKDNSNYCYLKINSLKEIDNNHIIGKIILLFLSRNIERY